MRNWRGINIYENAPLIPSRYLMGTGRLRELPLGGTGGQSSPDAAKGRDGLEHLLKVVRHVSILQSTVFVLAAFITWVIGWPAAAHLVLQH